MRWLMYFITVLSYPMRKKGWLRGRNMCMSVCVVWSDNRKDEDRKREVRNIVKGKWPSYSLQNRVLSWLDFTTLYNRGFCTSVSVWFLFWFPCVHLYHNTPSAYLSRCVQDVQVCWLIINADLCFIGILWEQ